MEIISIQKFTKEDTAYGKYHHKHHNKNLYVIKGRQVMHYTPEETKQMFDFLRK